MTGSKPFWCVNPFKNQEHISATKESSGGGGGVLPTCICSWVSSKEELLLLQLWDCITLSWDRFWAIDISFVHQRVLWGKILFVAMSMTVQINSTSWWGYICLTTPSGWHLEDISRNRTRWELLDIGLLSVPCYHAITVVASYYMVGEALAGY